MAKKTKNSLFSNEKFWRDYISSFFKSAAIKAALSFIRKKVGLALTGPMGWVAELVLGKLWDAFGGPTIRWAQRKMLLGVDKATGKIKVKKIKEAKEAGNVKDYNDAVDDLFK